MNEILGLPTRDLDVTPHNSYDWSLATLGPGQNCKTTRIRRRRVWPIPPLITVLGDIIDNKAHSRAQLGDKILPLLFP